MGEDPAVKMATAVVNCQIYKRNAVSEFIGVTPRYRDPAGTHFRSVQDIDFETVPINSSFRYPILCYC